MNRQALDDLKQQIPLMGYLQAHDWHPARPLSRGRWMGLCPLHGDHKPSFLVDANKDLFYCYGCGRGGDVIRFLACGLRRHEIAELRLDHLQQREGHWAIVDLIGKGRHVRTIPVPDWVQAELSDWVTAAGIQSGKLFRRVSTAGKIWGDGVSQKVVWHVVKEFAKTIGVTRRAPHDLRRTCARLCRAAGGELEQIQFLLGHVSVQTTERYLGCTQRIASAVNDRIGIEPR